MEAIQIISTQLKYDYDQLDLDAAITTRSAAIEIKTHAERAKSSMIFIGKLLADDDHADPGLFGVSFDLNGRAAGGDGGAQVELIVVVFQLRRNYLNCFHNLNLSQNFYTVPVAVNHLV